MLTFVEANGIGLRVGVGLAVVFLALGVGDAEGEGDVEAGGVVVGAAEGTGPAALAGARGGPGTKRSATLAVTSTTSRRMIRSRVALRGLDDVVDASGVRKASSDDTGGLPRGERRGASMAER